MAQRNQLIIASFCMGVGFALLGGCSSAPQKEPTSAYQDYKNRDGKPAKNLYDVDVSQIPDAEPRDEPFSRFGNKSPYVVFGESYTVLPSPKGYKERGIASWYGADFHGKKTSSWETYDMFRMTAAHKSLPLPCYAKVTNLQNGKQVIVKVNDRGPFHEGRIIDLSFAAAKKLEMAVNGTSQVEVEALDPADFNSKTWMDTVAKTNGIKVAPGVMTVPVNPMPSVKPEGKVPETASNNSAIGAGAVATATHLANGKTVLLPAVATKSNKSTNSAVASKPATVKVPEAKVATDKSANDKTKKLYLQVGAYAQQENAELLKDKLNKLKLSKPILISKDQSKHKVQIGPFETEQLAMQAQQRIRDANMGAPLIVRN